MIIGGEEGYDGSAVRGGGWTEERLRRWWRVTGGRNKRLKDKNGSEGGQQAYEDLSQGRWAYARGAEECN